MRYLNDILHGMEPTGEFVKLLTGEAARAAIATADACTRSRYETAKLIYQKSSVNKNNVKLTALWLRNQRAVFNVFFFLAQGHNIVMVLLDLRLHKNYLWWIIRSRIE